MGGGLSATSHTTCIGPSNTYSGSGLDKKKEKKKRKKCRVAVRVCLYMHTSVRGFVWLPYVCAVSGMGFSGDDERQ